MSILHTKAQTRHLALLGIGILIVSIFVGLNLGLIAPVVSGSFSATPKAFADTDGLSTSFGSDSCSAEGLDDDAASAVGSFVGISTSTEPNGDIVDESTEAQDSIELPAAIGSEEIIESEEPASEASKESRALNGWVQRNGGWYYYQNGVMLRNAWMMDSADWCWVGSDGRAFQNQWGWLYDSSGWNWYYFDNNTRIVRNAWQKDSVAWCYLNADGHALRNVWTEGRDPYGNYRSLMWFDGEYHARYSNESWAGYI
ncbi:hypothetical protein [Raoultibacter massiliensis]|uniref:hypothetical protein n=1 Tax=Raoultibacter massiliensis TaxID=1852371 RepID=UPI003A9331C0